MSAPTGVQAVLRCWCGNAELLAYSDDYRRCGHCGTLVSRRLFAKDLAHIRDEDGDQYGANYFFARARALNFPDLAERAHRDLSERCVFWLKALLAHRPPPATTLELGCASGAFVGLLASAGYAATGQDLSPAVTQMARATFGVPVLTGPIEELGLPEQSVDMLILMDVLEHLPDPIATLSTGARALRDDGLLFIQMPNYEPSLSHEDLVRTQHPFLAQLQREEHIYLYSRASAAALLAQLGFVHLAFLPAIFDMYDMFLVASRRPIAQVPETDWRQALRRTRESRIVEALVDAFDEARARLALERQLAQVEEDRARRLEVILAQQRELDGLRQQLSALRTLRGALRHWLGRCTSWARPSARDRE